MSLEVAIQENTSVLRELINIMSSVEIPSPITTCKKEEAEAKKTAVKKESKTEKPTASKEDSKPTDVTYDDAAKAVTTLARTKGRDTAIEVLGNFGIVKLPDAKPEQYAEIIAACTEVGEA